MWVIFHKGSNENILLSLLPYRKGKSQIKQYVEQMWIDRFLSFSEQLFYLNNKKKLPYHAQVAPYQNVPFDGRIICGYEGAEVWAIQSYAYSVEGDSITIYYKLPSRFNLDEPHEIEWKHLSRQLQLQFAN